MINMDGIGKRIGKPIRFQVPRPKHPLKVHVFGGLCRRGKTQLLIFSGIMDWPFYTAKCLTTYIDSAKALYPHGDVQMWADNDPKHTFKQARAYMLEHGVASIKTPAESPDMNPIENIWAQMKADIRSETPKTQEALCECITKAWERVDIKACNKYIDHVKNTVFGEVVTSEA